MSTDEFNGEGNPTMDKPPHPGESTNTETGISDSLRRRANARNVSFRISLRLRASATSLKLNILESSLEGFKPIEIIRLLQYTTTLLAGFFSCGVIQINLLSSVSAFVWSVNTFPGGHT